MAVKITDLIDPNEIDKLKQLDAELANVLTRYTDVAKSLAKGLEINVSVAGDIDKLESMLIQKGKEATTVQQQLTRVVEEQNKIVANTTNTLSRHLMEQERVNKTQREAYTEHDKVKRLLDQYHDTYDGQLQRLAQLKVQLDANKKEQKELEKALSAGKITTEQYAAKQAELIGRHRELTQEKRTLNQVMTAEEKMSQMQEGSYAHMSQQLELLKKAYKDLNEESRNTDYGKELEATIQNLDAHLKDMAADMGEHQRNVGNYAIANSGLRKEYDSLVSTLASLQTEYSKLTEEEKASDEGQKIAKNIDEVTTAAKDAKKALDDQTQAVEAARQSLGETSTTTASVKKDLKELVLEIANLSIEYQNLSEEEKASAEGRALADHIADLTEKAGVLKDAISDTNAAISNAASDTRGFDQLSGTIKLAIDGFGLAQGAAAMLGISSEELAAIQTKLQAAIAASNAMQSIQNTLQKQSSVMQGVNLVQTKLRTAAENLHTAAQGKGVIATKALTVAQWAFNAAANANPIGLLVAAIVAAIAVVYGLVKAFSFFFGSNEEAERTYETHKKGVEDLKKKNEEYIETLKAKGATEAELHEQKLENDIEESNSLFILVADAKRAYGEDSDEYREALAAKEEAREQWEKDCADAENYLQSIVTETHNKERELEIGTYAYKRELVDKEINDQIELANYLLENGRIAKETYQDIVNSLEKSRELKKADIDKKEAEEKARTTKRSGGGHSRTNNAQKQANDLKKAVQAGEDALLNIISDSLERQRQAEMLSYSRRLKELKDRLAKTKSTQVEMIKALNNQIEGLEAEHQKKMADLEFSQINRFQKAELQVINSRLAAVKEGSNEELDLRLKALNIQKSQELVEINKAEAEKTITTEQAIEMRANLVEKYANFEEQTVADHVAKMADLVEKRYVDEQTTRDTAYVVELNALKQKYARELADAKGNATKQESIKEKFEQDQARLSERYAKETARASVNMIEEILKNDKLSAEDRLKYEKELAKAKADLEASIADAAVAEIERVTDADNKAREKRLANAQSWLQTAADSLNTISELVSTVYDAKIKKVEEEQEANTAAGEAEIDRITDLVEKKVITEEEGDARKRAAEDQTARKNEELEKKQQQLQYKQAIWDKANSIAQVGINTAMSIMKTGAELGFPAAIPFIAIAGAMGAVQLATILATPIPKYAKGTDNHKGGPAIVGDGGVPELVVFGGQSWITPDKPTLVDLPAGAVVIPNISVINDDDSGFKPLPTSGNGNTPVIVNNDYKRLEEKSG